VAIVGATADLFDRNTTTPVRATTTTDASGYWAISHATEGRFDVRITNGTSIRWRKYDNQEQLSAIEVAYLRVRNPANTFDYDIVPAAILADRQLNLPLITATDTLASLGLAQAFTAAQQFTTIELGHATDTTISRSSAGVIAVEGVALVSGVTRAGGNTTEATTTSATAVDLMSVSSLSITAATPFWLFAVARKSTGAANNASCGLKLNTTVVSEAANFRIWATDAANAAQNGAFTTYVGGRVTNYTIPGIGHYKTSTAGGGDVTEGPQIVGGTADYPTATITDVVVRGIVGNAATTLGVDETHVYTMATS
jgi:hypothetical protein